MDTYDFLADPRAITIQERRATASRMAAEQAHWLQRLQGLIEGAPLPREFPAFLLATPPFAELAQRLGAARRRGDLPTEVADELDWFVAAFRLYLVTDEGENAFAGEARVRHRP